MKSVRGRKIAVTVLVCSLLAAVLGGCGSKKEDAVTRIGTAGVLRVAVCTQNNPMTVTDGTNYSGKEPQLVEQIADALKVTAEYIPALDTDEAKAMLSDQTADIAIGMITDKTSLEEGYECSDAYAGGRLYVLTRRGDYSDTPAAFSGATLGISGVLEAESTGWSTSVPSLKTVPYAEGSQAAADLKDKTIDGYVCRLEEGLDLVKDSDYLQLQNLKKVEEEQYVILTESGSGRLLQGINIIISRMLDGASEEAAGEETKTAGV